MISIKQRLLSPQNLISWALLVMLCLVTGCADVGSVAPAETNSQSNNGSGTLTVDKPAIVVTATALLGPAEATANQDAALVWSGTLLPNGEKAEACQSMVLTPESQAFIGPCDGTFTETELSVSPAREWPEMLARFAPFQEESAEETLDFRGRGEIGGPAWERAITFWARATAATLALGRVSATGPTVLAWNLGQLPGQPDTCQRLVVLAYGYATAALNPCEGGQMTVVGSGWIDTAQWEEFDVWLYANTPFYQNDNYLDGRGSNEMSTDEAVALENWAQLVYNEISQTGSTSSQPGQNRASNVVEAPPTIFPVIYDSGRYGIVDKTGQIVIEPIFDGTGLFSQGLAWVQIDNQYGYIDPTGQYVIEPQFSYAENFSGGVARVEIPGQYGLIDTSGQFIWGPVSWPR